MAEEVLEEKVFLEAEETRRAIAFFSPEGVVMLSLAGLLDLIGIILLCFALDDFWVTDVLGLLFIGLWIYFRSQTIKAPHRTAQKLTKAAKTAQRLRWLRPLLVLGEFIPYLGAAPCWTLLVYFELKS